MQVSEALSLIQSHGGFDPAQVQTSGTQQRAWLSVSVRQAIAESRWLKQRRDLGPTVAGTSEYAVDIDVIQLKMLRVGTSRPWAQTTLEALWIAEADSNAVSFSGRAPGVYAASFEEEAAQDVDDVPRYVKLWPAPDRSGLKIEATCAVSHKKITADTPGTYVLQVPDDLVEQIAVDGAIARGLTLVSERADLAAPFLQRHVDAKAELKRRANSQLGGGVRYVPVRGR